MPSSAASPIATQASPPVGGFFGLHEPEGAAGNGSVLASWTGGRTHGAFVNARSAFAALAARHGEAAVWAPAFLCKEMAAAVPPHRQRFYPVREGFTPDLAPVEAAARPGDLVLVVAYFGLPAGAVVEALAARRPDLRLVEDRAQALDAGPAAPASWALYSPRKLLGVADGGLLVAPAGGEVPPQPAAAPDAAALWTAPLLRYEDPEGRANAAWHAANQTKEAAMAPGGQAMTRLSLSILSRTSLQPLAAARLRNWRTLDRALRPWSALPPDPAWPPLGYVLDLAPALRERLRAVLHGERIFAAVHWPAIAAPAEDFPREQDWTRRLLTLPCDHRYGEAEMARIARLALRVLA